jgi:coenzyme F420-reducing hydrogenase alpha subunit
LNIEHFARVEGHGNVRVKVEDGTLTAVEMNVTEAARFFESMVRGRPYTEVTYVSSRICGICSPSHTVTSLLAIEDAFGLAVSERSARLRELLIYGSYLQNHATHLYFLAAPDYLSMPDIWPLSKASPEAFANALAIKQLGNELCTAVGGRSIHPVNAVVGGFTSEPGRPVLAELAGRLDAAVRFAEECCDLFKSFSAPALETAGDFLSLVEPDAYAVASGCLKAVRQGWSVPVGDYKDRIHEAPVRHSNAKLSTLDNGQTYFTGALARINNSWAQLSQQAKLMAAKVGLRPVALNSYRNNLAQAVELVDACVRCAEICRWLLEDDGSSAPVKFEVSAASGTGATEAPRGVLFHELGFDAAGRVDCANIVTPTAQNLANLENDIRLLAPMILDQAPDEFEMQISKLIRAYDPCLSCSVH